MNYEKFEKYVLDNVENVYNGNIPAYVADVEQRLNQEIEFNRKFGSEDFTPFTEDRSRVELMILDTLSDEVDKVVEGIEFKKLNKENMVNHPKHYSAGKYECIDVMQDIFTDDEMIAWCKLNVFKYIYRANRKNGSEDIKKAQYYMNYMCNIIE